MIGRVITTAVAVASWWPIPSALEAQWYSRIGHHGYVTHPVVAEDGVTLSAHYARGLNEDSYRTNYFGGRLEIASNVLGVWGGIGWLKPSLTGQRYPEVESQVGVNAGAAVHLLRRLFQLSLQIGAGYLDKESQTGLRILGGPCLAVSFTGSSSTIRSWVMPYMQIQDVSDGNSSRQEGGFGTSAGVEWRPSRLGLLAALDWSWTDLGDIGYAGGDQSMVLLDFGLSYRIN